MWRKYKQLAWRWRWPGFLGLVVGVILYFVLQPRPVAEYRLTQAVVPGAPPVMWLPHRSHWKVSPTGRYLLQFDDLNNHFVIYDLQQASYVLEHSVIAGFDALVFDGEDGLVFADYGKAPDAERPELMISVLELWHWSPRQGLRKAGPYQLFYPELPNQVTHSNEHYNGLRKLGQDEYVNGLSSPDGGTWLLPRRGKGVCLFELINARTGELRARLGMADISLEEPRFLSLDVAFTKDSTRLVTYANPLKQQRGGIRLEWWDAQTGTHVASTLFPQAVEMGKVITVEPNQVYAVRKVKNAPCLQRFGINGEYQEVFLDEAAMLPGLTKADVNKPIDLDYETAMLQDGKWTCFQQYTVPQRDMLTDNIVLRWEVHDLRSSRTVYGGAILNTMGRGYDLFHIPDGKLLAGRHLVFRFLGEPQEKWKHQLENWRQKWWPALPQFFPLTQQLTSIDLETGRELAKVSLPLSVINCVHHPGNRSLYVLDMNTGQIVVRQYAYPFRSPWGLIGMWSGGVFVVMVLLREWWGRGRQRSVRLG